MLSFLTSVYTNIKNYVVFAIAIGGAIFAAMFFYERNKVQVVQALLDEDKMNEKLEKDDNAIASNDVALKTEEQKREDLNVTPTPTPPSNLAQWFNNRK